MCPLCSVFFGIQHVESRLCFILRYIQAKFVRPGSNFSLQKWIEIKGTFLVHCPTLLHHQKKGTNIASTLTSASGWCLEGFSAAATTCHNLCQHFFNHNHHLLWLGCSSPGVPTHAAITPSFCGVEWSFCNKYKSSLIFFSFPSSLPMHLMRGSLLLSACYSEQTELSQKDKDFKRSVERRTK